MIRKNINVDVIMDVLELTMAAHPTSNFIKSLTFQYQQRGGLSKKQLQDLHEKAAKIGTMPVGKLATLEAIILKKPTRYKSPEPTITAPDIAEKNNRVGELINEILSKYPLHKMVMFFKAKYDNDEPLTPANIAEVERLHKILL